jgi:hypothetical protein
MRYVVLIYKRTEPDNRYHLFRNTLEEARAVAYQYDKDNKFSTSIYEIGEDLRY